MHPDNKDAEESKADISESASSSSSNLSDDFLNPLLQTSSSTMLIGEANAIIDQWIKHCSTIDWKLYRSENINDQVNEKMRLIEVLQDADPFIWFRKHGHLFPCISLLAREQFSKMDSTAVQERFFSAASAAMTKHQTRMDPLHHEKRVVLNQNAEFMGK